MTTQVPSDNVRAGLAKIRGALDWIDSKLPGVKIDGDHRYRIPAQLYDLALEHAASILHLIETCRYASAFALVRCEFECFGRGAWIHNRATAADIEKLVKMSETKPQIRTALEAPDKEQPLAKTNTNTV